MGSKVNLRYHIVLVSKYRRPVFSGIEDDILEAFRVAESCSSFKLESVSVENGDHVHLILRTSGTYSLSKTIARVKSIVCHELWEKHSGLLSNFYWSGNHKLWSGGYYAATVGDVSIEHVKKYLQKQGHWN